MNWQTLIREVNDFPKSGIVFKDIMPVLSHSEGFEALISDFKNQVSHIHFDAIVGIESRGFILGAALSQSIKKGFIPVRKKGKLPPPIISESYQLEYGTDTLEINPGQGRVLIVDDVLATGGTATATVKLCERAGYQVQGAAVVIDLQFLNQWRMNGQKMISLIQVN